MIKFIPGGSTDATCHGIHGTSDVTTAALHIIMGESRNVDVAGIYSDNKLQAFSTTMASYGYLGDLVNTAERWRCFGPSRYIMVGALQILKNRAYNATVKIQIPKDGETSPITCEPTCSDYCIVCSKAAIVSNISQDHSTDNWIQV